MKKPKPCITLIKHSGHLRTLEKCRKHSPAARVFYAFLVFSNARRVLSQCNTRLRLLYLLTKTVFDKSERAQPSPIRIIRLHTRREVSSNTWLKCAWSNLVLRVSHLPAHWSERSRAQKREPSLLSLQGAGRWETLGTRLLQVHLKVSSRALKNLVSHLMRKYVTSSIFALLL